MPVGDSTQGRRRPNRPYGWMEIRGRMPMLAEVVDAVVGGDTHRDTHAVELTAPSGATIATLMIGNDERGFAEAIAWVAKHAPGPRVVVGLEGTRSYGIGLVRVLQAARRPIPRPAHPDPGARHQIAHPRPHSCRRRLTPPTHHATIPTSRQPRRL
jgi:hypothetical protein